MEQGIERPRDTADGLDRRHRPARGCCRSLLREGVEARRALTACAGHEGLAPVDAADVAGAGALVVARGRGADPGIEVSLDVTGDAGPTDRCFAPARQPAGAGS